MDKETMRSDTAFYLVMSLVSAALLFLGFAPSFYLKGMIDLPVPPLSPLSIMHGLVFSAWVVLFIAQVALIRVNRIGLHRQLGILGAVLFGAMFSLGISTAITGGRLGHSPPGSPAPPLAIMALPFISLIGILGLVALALLYRRRTDWHKRLMLAVLFSMTPPGTGRLLINLGHAAINIHAALAVTEVLILILMAYDWRVYRRLHPASVIGLSVAVATHVAIFWAFFSPTWMVFAQWLTRT